MTIAVEDLALVHPLQAFTPFFKPQSAIVVPAEIANIEDQLPELDPFLLSTKVMWAQGHLVIPIHVSRELIEYRHVEATRQSS